MKVIRKRCEICLAWYSPTAHMNHCPFCGAFKSGHKHYAMSADGNKVRELFSAVHVPLALRHNYFTK
jgi:hypothetical protein